MNGEDAAAQEILLGDAAAAKRTGRLGELCCKRVSSFITDATDDKGHYRTENCTKQEAPPGGYKRQTIKSQTLPPRLVELVVERRGRR